MDTATRFIISADDFGLTRSITDQILDCADHGALSSVSIMANGAAFEYALAAYKQRAAAGLRLSIHLNLLEGKPVLPVQDVGMLVDKKGEFCHSFVSLWLKYIVSGARDKALLKQQVHAELRAQVRKVIRSFPEEIPVNIDGHLHAHLIPFVFDALCALAGEFRFAYVRLPAEPALRGDDAGRDLKAFVSVNHIKHLLLNALSRRALPRLKELQVPHCRYFVGLLYSGCMDVYAVRAALKRIPAAEAAVVEILFHPFQAPPEEEHLWRDRPSFLRYYRSGQRQCERQTLKSRSFQTCLRKERL